MIIGKAQSRVALALFVVVLLFFCVFYIYPLVNGIYISFTDWNGLSLHYSFIGLDNYRTMFADKQFNESLIVTVKYMAAITVSSMLLGYIEACLLSSLKKYGRLMESVVIFPYIMMPVMVYILFKSIFTGLLPYIGKTYNLLFLKSNFLASKDTALWACVFTDIWMLVPYTSYIFLAAKNKIPSSVIEASRLDGAGSLRRLWYIEIPYILSSIGSLAVICLTYGMTHIDTIMTLTGGGPRRSTETIYYIVFKNSFLKDKYGLGMAEGAVIALICVLLYATVNFFTARYDRIKEEP